MSNNNNMNQCPICRELVSNQCIECQVGGSNSHSDTNTCHRVRCSCGCGYKFHEHCLDRWHNLRGLICPMSNLVHTVIRLFSFGTKASTAAM